MVLGVGIDLVYLPEFRRLCGEADDPFRTHTFTEAERAFAAGKPDPEESLAGMFAVKEAVTKALAPLMATTGAEGFDMRRIETLHRADGSPYVSCCPPLSTFMEAAGVESILVSITNEQDYAQAIALPQGSGDGAQAAC